MVGVCSCVQEKEAIPQKLHQACTDFRSQSIFQLWLKQLSQTSHQILFWQLNFTFGSGRVAARASPCPAVTDVAKVCRAARGAVEQHSQPQTPALRLQIHTVPPELSRGIQLVLKGSRPSVRPSSRRVRNHCTLFGNSLACCVSAVPTRPFLCLLSFNKICL